MRGPLKGYQWTTGSSYEYITGNYEVPLVLAEFCSWFTPAAVFYDLGANIGFYSLIADQYIRTGRIYSFEPVPANRQLFEKHLQLNSPLLRSGKISIEPFAIADQEKTISFSNDTRHRDGNTYISASPVFTAAKDLITVQCYSIDDWVQQGHERPDIIKIDVEGAEYEVLQGAIKTLQQYKPNLLLATHDYHLPGVKDQCVEYLKQLGYTVRPAGHFNKQLTGLDDYIAVHPGRSK